ncbi:MAG: DUF559 domain-containing protein [Actinomycetota bacterium]|nr:DUF559 domain-containing protein [Actinomycetota bacterium]
MTVGQVGQRVRAGHWEIVGRGVYRVAGSVPTWEQRVLTAVLATGDNAAASRRTAASLWRLPGFRREAVEVTQRRGPSSRQPATGLHDSRFLPSHQVRVVDAIPVTCPARTVLDLCGCVHPLRAERALDNALAMELATVADIGAMLAETGARGRPGTALLRRLMAVRTADYVAPASELEALVMAVLAADGVPPPDRQEWVGGTRAPAGRVDFAFREARVVVEADSRRHHSSWLDVQADHRRDLLLITAGWRVVRVNWHQLVEDPGLFTAAIRSVLRRAAAA